MQNKIHDGFLQLGLEPVFSLGEVVFYSTKDYFKKHNFGRDVKRFVNKTDWCIYANRYHLNARGVVTLGFAKKQTQITDLVWSVLNLLSCDTDLELNQNVAALDFDDDFIVPPLALTPQILTTTTTTTTTTTVTSASAPQQIQSPHQQLQKQLSSPSLNRLSTRVMRESPAVGSFESPRSNTADKPTGSVTRSGSKDFGVKRTESNKEGSVKRAGSNKEGSVKRAGSTKEAGITRTASGKEYISIYSPSPTNTRMKIKTEKAQEQQQPQNDTIMKQESNQQLQQTQQKQQKPEKQKIQSFQIPDPIMIKPEPPIQNNSNSNNNNFFINFGKSNSKRMAFDLGAQSFMQQQPPYVPQQQQQQPQQQQQQFQQQLQQSYVTQNQMPQIMYAHPLTPEQLLATTPQPFQQQQIQHPQYVQQPQQQMQQPLQQPLQHQQQIHHQQLLHQQPQQLPRQQRRRKSLLGHPRTDAICYEDAQGWNYEADRELERQNNFFLMLGDELVAPMDLQQSVGIYGGLESDISVTSDSIYPSGIDDYDMNYIVPQHQHEPWKM